MRASEELKEPEAVLPPEGGEAAAIPYRAHLEPDPPHPTIVAGLREAARAHAGAGIAFLPERERKGAETRTWAEILQEAEEMASGFADLGVREGDRVLLVLPTGRDFVAAFFGAQLLGAVPVPAYPPTKFRLEGALDRLAHIARHAGAVLCVTWRAVRSLLGDLGHRAPSLSRIVLASELRGTRPPPRFAPSPETPACIQYTSGSTGRPKGVLLTHANLAANIHAISHAIDLRRSDVVVSWAPLYHDMGLIGTFLLAAYRSIPLVLMSPTSFLSRPRRWLQAITDYGGTLSASPNFGYALAARKVPPEERQGLDLSSWRAAFNGAEPITAEAMENFRRAYAPYGFRAEALTPVYGLAEATLAVSVSDLQTPPRTLTVDRDALVRGAAEQADADAGNAQTVVSAGRAIPGHRVRVLNERGRPAGAGEVGEIATWGPSAMRGYFEDPDATSETFSGDWVRTGDLGFVWEGEVYVTGRAKDVIIVCGQNYHAEDIEQIAEEVEGVRRGGSAAFAASDETSATERVVIVCETALEDDEARRQLADRVSAEIARSAGLTIDEVAIAPAGSVPKTSSGKRQRSVCRARYLDGELGESPQAGWLDIGWVFARAQTGEMKMRARRWLRTGGGES